jgi:hypothetical protein
MRLSGTHLPVTKQKLFSAVNPFSGDRLDQFFLYLMQD